ncbi:condensation domain-containing protein [Actinomadura livida]|uniref:Condensation domain-containing protein n=1 Tax=Actinomadura livida TaxID=79909 RepID=A0A7W7MVB8_9ACTN|nr:MULTISPECIES: condensation domain-containing protein [Actinomadura]MBB4772388.1 hypothetical protein [Actinomadura catellatispora]GGU23297.1 hypothetical protein GCM10010208_55450 [Actinomadura livida]
MTSVVDPGAAGTDTAPTAPLSCNQKFICMFDRGDDQGPFGPMYGVNYAYRISGEIDLGVLREALRDVVERHESLRCEIVRGIEQPYQRFLPAGAPRLVIRDLPGGSPADRDRQVEDLLCEIEAEPFSIREMPQLRAVLGRFDELDGVLVLVAHHTAADGWSMQLIMRDLVHLYAARRGHDVPALPEAPQYREYVAWEEANDDSPAMRRNREFWRAKYRDAEAVPIRTDHPRSAGLPKATAWHRFLIEKEPAAVSLDLAREMRATPFMVFLSAYHVLMSRLTEVTDLAVLTLTAGRSQQKFHDTVGNFYNFLPVRTDITGCETFREVVERTRKGCLESFTHEMSFHDIMGQVPHLMAPLAADDLLVPAFQVLGSEHAPETEQVGDLRFAEVRRRLRSQDEGIDVPEGALWTLDVLPSKEIVGSLGFNSNRWTADTMRAQVAVFIGILEKGSAAPDAPLAEIA